MFIEHLSLFRAGGCCASLQAHHGSQRQSQQVINNTTRYTACTHAAVQEPRPRRAGETAASIFIISSFISKKKRKTVKMTGMRFRKWRSDVNEDPQQNIQLFTKPEDVSTPEREKKCPTAFLGLQSSGRHGPDRVEEEPEEPEHEPNLKPAENSNRTKARHIYFIKKNCIIYNLFNRHENWPQTTLI